MPADLPPAPPAPPALVRPAPVRAIPSSTIAIADAVDAHAEEIAADQGWVYTDRTDVRGDWRRMVAVLWFLVPNQRFTECDRGHRNCVVKVGTWEWEVEVVADRCAPGDYAVRTLLGGDECTAPVGSWNAWDRWGRIGWPLGAVLIRQGESRGKVPTVSNQRKPGAAPLRIARKHWATGPTSSSR